VGRARNLEDPRAVAVILLVEVLLARIKILIAISTDHKTITIALSTPAGEVRIISTKSKEATSGETLWEEVVVYNKPHLKRYLRNFMVIQIIAFAKLY